MLIEAYEYAVSNRESILSRLDRARHSAVIDKARERWVNYIPRPSYLKVSGIDSSWNAIPYQGFYLYAVDAVSVLPDSGHLVPPKYKVGLDTLEGEEDGERVYNPRLQLETMGMEFEYQLAKESVKAADLVLVDGSVLARFYDRKQKKVKKFYEYARDLVSEEKVVFVSKTSESNIILDGPVGDIYYFNRASSSPGYSRPYYDPVGVSILYAKLAESAPCIKVEVPGRVAPGAEKEVLDALCTGSVLGYPYVLRAAHERCKVHLDDINRVADTLGLSAEIGGRDVLGE
jgi:hypothetical protein